MATTHPMRRRLAKRLLREGCEDRSRFGASFELEFSLLHGVSEPTGKHGRRVGSFAFDQINQCLGRGFCARD